MFTIELTNFVVTSAQVDVGRGVRIERRRRRAQCRRRQGPGRFSYMRPTAGRTATAVPVNNAPMCLCCEVIYSHKWICSIHYPR
ncbi:unnamed protein product [Euphydryas editha]|uniref:Uncharacterized protein n=1 Tax=Euphydryas editha TaxID=104508 RepID=A0AAU9TR41_EUPED|nr:unnamed protein product [Euphydryas editha]